jgi:sugar/nucleoside kinase (ribokinase family)
MGQRGAIVFRDDKEDMSSFFTIDSFVDRLVDPVGAGDALLAYSTLAFLVTRNEVIASILGSVAASVECEKDGNIPVTPVDILQKIDALEKCINYA